MMMQRIKIERHPQISSFRLSRAVAELRFLRGADKAVLRTLCDRYPNCFPGISNIALQSGVSERWARQALRNLEFRWKLIVNITPQEERGGGRGHSEQYFIRDRAILDALAVQKLWDAHDKLVKEQVLPRAGLTVKNPKRFARRHAKLFKNAPVGPALLVPRPVDPIQVEVAA